MTIYEERLLILCQEIRELEDELYYLRQEADQIQNFIDEEVGND